MNRSTPKSEVSGQGQRADVDVLAGHQARDLREPALRIFQKYGYLPDLHVDPLAGSPEKRGFRAGLDPPLVQNALGLASRGGCFSAPQSFTRVCMLSVPYKLALYRLFHALQVPYLVGEQRSFISMRTSRLSKLVLAVHDELIVRHPPLRWPG
jgi:hypothetical protein